MACWQSPIPAVCVENPVPHGHAGLPPWTQTIQPYHFGADASKRTCLWLRGLPPLCGRRYVEPRLVCDCGRVFAWADAANGCPACGSTTARPRWANQTNGGQNKLAPSPERAARRAETYPGIAAGMAEQWSAWLTGPARSLTRARRGDQAP